MRISHSAEESPPPPAGRLAGRDAPHARRRQEGWQSRSQVPLQDDRVVLDGAAATERLFELATPTHELVARQVELLDDRHFFAAALLALETHHRTRGTALRRLDLGR